MIKRNETAPLRAEDLVARLRDRYAGEEWAFFSELRGGTGWSRESRMDALAMNLWPSRGLEVHGFEVKVSRGDWRRELAAPAKAEELQGFCDRWWIVTADDALVFPGELPPTWGWMVPHGQGLRVKTEAPKLQAQSLDRAFVAAILRRAGNDDAVKVACKAAVNQAQKRWEAEDRRAQKRQASRAEAELAALQKQVELFETASGVRIRGYADHPRNIGEAVRMVLESGDSGRQVVQRLELLAKDARRVADEAERALAQWPEDGLGPALNAAGARQ